MSIVAKVPTRFKPFISLQQYYVCLSVGTRRYFQSEYIEILEGKGGLAFIPVHNGQYRLCLNGTTQVIYSIHLSRFLQKRCSGEWGRFTLVPVPVIRNDYPKGTVALATSSNGPIDHSYTPIDICTGIFANDSTLLTDNIPIARLPNMFANVSLSVTRFPMFSLEKLKPSVSFYTAPGIAVVVQDPNSNFHFYCQKGKLLPKICSTLLAQFLANHFGRHGRFDAKFYNHPDFDSPVLVFAENLPSESSLANTSLSPVNMPVPVVIPHVVVNKNEVHLYPFTPSLSGSVRLMRCGDIFAVISDPLSFIPYKQQGRYGLIHSKILSSTLKNTKYQSIQAWECNGIYFFTTNAEKYKSTSSLAGFVPFLMRQKRLRTRSTVNIWYRNYILSIPSPNTKFLAHSKYLSLAVSGDFCLLYPDPNGPYQIHHYGISLCCCIQSAFVCRFLLEKFKDQRIFHSKFTKQGLIFSPALIENIPDPQTFKKIINPKIPFKITFYDTPTEKYIELPYITTRYLSLKVSFYQCKEIWAIVSDENGPYRFWKKNHVIYCANLIPKIRVSLHCGEISSLFIRKEKNIVYFSNSRLTGPLPDFSHFKPVE